MPLTINIIGIGRGSGKTSLVEALTRELTQRTYKVWTVKHISGSFNTVRKDTWKHLEAGALAVMAVTPNELVSIKKIPEPSLEAALEKIPKELGIVIVEGFKSSKYPKIITSRIVKDASKLMKRVKEVFAISGPVAERESGKSINGVPILKPDELVPKVEGMIIDYAVKGLPDLNCGSCGVRRTSRM